MNEGACKMPQIKLKQNSPEFDELRQKPQPQTVKRRCDMPGCTHSGDHRAPKNRSLKDYYHFCLDHVQEYNQAWNFFSGMADQDVERQIISDLYGDRPTWRADAYRGFESELRRKIHEARTFEDIPEDEPASRPMTGNPQIDALTLLGLTAPVTFDQIKLRYRALVKKYHPDHQIGTGVDPRITEEKLKEINMAYTVLKAAYQI